MGYSEPGVGREGVSKLETRDSKLIKRTSGRVLIE